MDLTTLLLTVIGGLLVYIAFLQLQRSFASPPPPTYVVVPAAAAGNSGCGVPVVAALLILGALVVAVYLGLLPIF